MFLRESGKWEKAAAFTLLALVVVLVVVFASGLYTAALGADHFGIVHFAQHLSRGRFYSDFPVYNWVKPRWAPGEDYFVLGGVYVNHEGNMYCKYTIGFPLIMAASIRLLGKDSVYYVNVIVLSALVLVHFLFGLTVFRRHPRRHWLAVLAPLILLVVVDPAWRMAMRPTHDLSGILFVIAGALAAVLALRDSPRIGILAWSASAFCFGFSGALRLPNVLTIVPVGLYFLFAVAGKIHWTKIIGLSLLGVFFFSLALSPALIQNQLTGGHPLRPPRPEIVSEERTVLGGLDQKSPPPLWIGFFPTTFPQVARYFWRLWGPLFSLLFLLGLVSYWRLSETKWLLIGVPLILILLYSMWVHLMTRYMLVAHPFLIILMVGGVARLLQTRPRWWSAAGLTVIILLDYLMRSQLRYQYRFARLNLVVLIAGVVLWLLFVAGKSILEGRWSPAILAAVFFSLFGIRYGLPWLRRPPIFQLEQARLFGRDLDSLIPPESVVFSTKPIFNYINLFSSSYSLRPFEMGRIGVAAREGFDRLLERGTRLFVLDNNSYKRDAGKSIPLFREYYDVLPVGKLKAEHYRLAQAFGKPEVTVSEISHWREKEATVELEVPRPGEDHLLVVNLPRLWEEGGGGRKFAIELNGNLLDHSFQNFFNFLRVPAADLRTSRVTLRAVSDLPLPAQLDAELRPWAEDWPIDLSRQLSFPDNAAPERFSEARLRDADMVRLYWGQTGLLYVPTVSEPGEELILEAALYRTQALPVPVGLEIKFNGTVIKETVLPTDRDSGRLKVAVHLPGELFDSARGEVEFRAYLAGDHVLTAAEHRSGALLFDELTLRRYVSTLKIGTGSDKNYYLVFNFDPALFTSGHSAPYQLFIGDRLLRENLAPGIQRILLSSEEVEVPVSHLWLYSPLSDSPLWLDPAFVLIPDDSGFTIDIGGADDWAFIQKGFFDREKYNEVLPVRWTGGSVRLLIPVFPATGSGWTAEFKVVMTGPPRPGPLTEMKVFLDGKSAGTIALSDGEGRYRLPLPDINLDAPALLPLDLQLSTWRPDRVLGVPDPRQLGVMLDWIRIELPEK